jgi:NAD(P)-dependent dehydrogenase (short-subunit alcohol dehydrogenase family)
MFQLVEARFGGLDVLVNNAFWSDGDTTITELAEEVWDRTIDVTLKGPFLCTQRAILLMLQAAAASSRFRSVNAYSSERDRLHGGKGRLIAMMRLTRRVRRPEDPVELICPTIATRNCMTYWEARPEGFEMLKPCIRWGASARRDVANCALFLASDESSWSRARCTGFGAYLPAVNRNLRTSR